MVPTSAWALAALLALPAEGPPRVLSVLAEFDRMAARPLWPGFEPAGIPLEIYDRGSSWLVRHPRPPQEFQSVPGHVDVRVFAGRHESLRANSSVELARVTTATASFPDDARDPRRLAALLLHEAFHVFEGRRHAGWAGNEVDLLTYPVDDARLLALRRLESEALRRAIEASNERDARAWAARAVEERRLRYSALPASASAYERGTELKEGLARYVEASAAGVWEPLFGDAEFGPAAIRDRAYSSGCAIALLLDRLDRRWKRSLDEKDDFLDEMLRRVVGDSVPAQFPEAEREAAARRAAEDLAAWRRSLSERKAEFLARDGWRLVLESDAPLFPQGFDPLNLEKLSESEVLHTRFLKLGNATGMFEALDRSCLTDSRGSDPLFQGVRRATVSGLPVEPAVEESDDGVKVAAPGIMLSFRGARVVRSGRVVTVVVPVSR